MLIHIIESLQMNPFELLHLPSSYDDSRKNNYARDNGENKSTVLDHTLNVLCRVNFQLYSDVVGEAGSRAVW